MLRKSGNPPRRRKKIARRRCGKTGGLRPDKPFERPRGGGDVQDHGADGMFCGSFAAAGRGGAGDGLVPEAGVMGGFRAGEVQGDVAPAFALLRSMQRSAAASGGKPAGGARPTFQTGSGPVDAMPAWRRIRGRDCWRIWVDRAGRRSVSPGMGGALPSPPSDYGDTSHCMMFVLCSILHLSESRSRNGV